MFLPPLPLPPVHCLILCSPSCADAFFRPRFRAANSKMTYKAAFNTYMGGIGC